MSVKKSMVVTLGSMMLLLAACSTAQVPAGTSGTMTGKNKAPVPSSGFGMGGGMMGGMMGGDGGYGGMGGAPSFVSSEKSYGVVTFERPDGFRVRSVIDWNGTSFSNPQTFAYPSEFFPGVGGGLAQSPECFPQISYLTLGDSGTVRFTRKNKDLFARVTFRTRSGKLVPDTSKRPQDSCPKEFPKIEKVKGLSEKILTELVPMVPGKETRVVLGKTTVTVFIDKDFPVGRVPAYPAFSSQETGAFGGGMSGGLGAMVGAGMMGEDMGGD